MATPALAIFTGKGIETMLSEGGTGNWVLDRNKARTYEYVVCMKNKHAPWSEGGEEHGAAFIIGKIKDVVLSPEYTKDDPRFVIQFDEYATVTVPGAWKGWRNPVRYTSLEELGIDINEIDFRENLVSQAGPTPPTDKEEKREAMLTIAEAKVQLARTFGVEPEAIEITIRG